MNPMGLADSLSEQITEMIPAFEQQHGCMPAALILHPTHADAFAHEPEPGSELLDRVSIIVSPLFEPLVPVGQQGNNHEL
ncbi:hypothetical protein WJ542_23225 [Paraburkholderia sp. B3]|uniref:hypothetical protein n=1 Tax=Paraburkholderia sp. B3 TaxID=3134791 RepID=UPI0039828E9D